MVSKILLFLSFSTLCFCEETPRIIVKDSYLEAFKQVHQIKSPKLVHNQKITNRDSKVEEKNGYPSANYEPSHQYGHPVPSYGPPAPVYGAPQPNYGPPAPVYGPPAPVYGPPQMPR